MSGFDYEAIATLDLKSTQKGSFNPYTEQEEDGLNTTKVVNEIFPPSFKLRDQMTLRFGDQQDQNF